MGLTDRPGGHHGRPQGVPQVRHQRHHQGRRRQDPAQERARRGWYRGVSLSCVKGNLLFIYPFKSIQDVVLWQLKMYLINYLPSSFIQPMLKVQEQIWGTFVFLKFEIAGDIERLPQLFLRVQNIPCLVSNVSPGTCWCRWAWPAPGSGPSSWCGCTELTASRGWTPPSCPTSNTPSEARQGTSSTHTSKCPSRDSRYNIYNLYKHVWSLNRE